MAQVKEHQEDVLSPIVTRDRLSEEDLPQEKIRSKGSKVEELARLQREAFEAACALPFPKPTSELWRYTSPQLFSFDSLKAIRVPQVSASFGDERKIPAGVSVATIDTLTALDHALINRVAHEGGDAHTDKGDAAVEQLQRAFFSSITVVRVAPGVQVDELLSLDTVLPPAEAPTDAPQITSAHIPLQSASTLLIIEIGRGASLDVREVLRGASRSFIFPRVELIIGDGGRCRFHTLQTLDPTAQALGFHHLHLGQDANAEYGFVGLGARVSRFSVDCLMSAPGGNAMLTALHVGDKKQHMAFHSVQSHLAPHCRSDLMCKNAMKNTARSVYYGYIRVAEKAHQTDAYQTNRNLLLSPLARADSIPNLEIKANDVKCSHGASVSQVSDEELFYFQSRGLTKMQAEQLLTEGFFHDVLSRLSHQPIREQLSNEVFSKLG